MDEKLKLKNKFVNTYLDYVEDTEPPRIFHVWSLISAAGGSLGRRCFYNLGRIKVYPNTFVLLVGPPGVRKSTTINEVQRFLRSSTRVRFAPSDTAGARQGLIAAMEGDSKEATDEEEAFFKGLERAGELTDIEKLGEVQLDTNDAHTMFICASEFNTFIGQNSLDMITFLTKAWDGEDYDYRLKKEQLTLHSPLLSILGGTTPTSIANSMPPGAIGGGFMSRIIHVFGAAKYKSIARPAEASQALGETISARFNEMSYDLNGPFIETGAAKSAIDELYKYQVDIKDPRFLYYIERRHDHFIKTVICLTALRGSQEVSLEDVEDAQALMIQTEAGMPDALGEYGLSPASIGVQKMLELIQHSSPTPVLENNIMAVMRRDIKQVDVMNGLLDMQNSGKIKKISTKYGPAYIYLDKNNDVAEAIRLLGDLGDE